jgi:hypothetical protein
MPVTDRLGAKTRQRLTVGRDGVVRKMSLYYASQPLSLLGDGLMLAPLQFGLHLVQLLPHPLPHRPPHDEELPCPGLPADMRKAQEIEALRLPLTPLLSVGRGIAPKLEDTGLLGVQLQRELPQSLAELSQEPLGVRAVLESNDEVVGKARDDDAATCVPSPPLLNPQVEDVVEVDVRQQG